MAALSEVNPHQHLYNNLILLNELNPGSSDFVKCIKENMFAKPNRTAFDLVLFYLCSTYDARYISKVPWPILDRSQERTFRQNSVAFIKDIIKEKPEARIPSFSPSFLSTPGGERFTKFMWKFSLLVLKTVVERESDDIVLDYPTEGLNLVEDLTELTLTEVANELNDTCQLISDATKYSKKINNDIVNKQTEISSLRSVLTEILQRSEHCPLSHEEKRILVGEDKAQADALLQKWLAHIHTDVENAKTMLNDLKDQTTPIVDCYNSVKTFVDSKTLPVVLDASSFPSKLKGSDGNLDLAYILSEGANAANTLLNTISMYGGFQRYEHILPSLETLREQLQTVEISLADTKAGFNQMSSTCLESMNSAGERTDEMSSPLKGRLQAAYEMLQDAHMSTPPLVFHEHGDVILKSRISIESPPINVVDSLRPPRSKSSHKDGIALTPKASHTTGLSSKSLVGRTALYSSVPKRDLKSLKDSEKFALNSSVMQTPASFRPKQFATSTACKPTSLLTSSGTSRNLNLLSSSKKGTVGATKERCRSSQGALQQIKEVGQNEIGSHSTFTLASSQEGNGVKTAAVDKEAVKEANDIMPLVSETRHKFAEKAKKDSFPVIDCEEVPSESPVLGSKISQSSSKDFKPDFKQGKLSAPSDFEEPSKSPRICWKKDNSVTQTMGKLPSSPSRILHTPVQSPTFQQKNQKLLGMKDKIPEIVVSNLSSHDVFDSPQSTCGMFSPPSADNSFFTEDVQMNNSGFTVPKFDLNFEDDISPSGRVSLCPPINDLEPKVPEVPIVPSDQIAPQTVSSRRKSLQDVIHRYRDLVATLKPYEPVKLSPPVSPEQDMQIDANFDDLNFE